MLSTTVINRKKLSFGSGVWEENDSRAWVNNILVCKLFTPGYFAGRSTTAILRWKNFGGTPPTITRGFLRNGRWHTYPTILPNKSNQSAKSKLIFVIIYLILFCVFDSIGQTVGDFYFLPLSTSIVLPSQDMQQLIGHDKSKVNWWFISIHRDTVMILHIAAIFWHGSLILSPAYPITVTELDTS